MFKRPAATSNKSIGSRRRLSPGVNGFYGDARQGIILFSGADALFFFFQLGLNFFAFGDELLAE